MPRPKKFESPPVQISVRLPKVLYARLKTKAKEEGISMNDLIIRLLRGR